MPLFYELDIVKNALHHFLYIYIYIYIQFFQISKTSKSLQRIKYLWVSDFWTQLCLKNLKALRYTANQKEESPLPEVTCLNGLNSRISQSTRWQSDIYPNPTESRHIWTLLWSCLLLMFTFHWPIFHPAHGKWLTYRSRDEVTVSARFQRRSAEAACGGHALFTASAHMLPTWIFCFLFILF